MKELLKELAWKCYENGLFFTIYSDGDLLDVSYHAGDEAKRVTNVIFKNYPTSELPSDALKRALDEVDEFLIGLEVTDEEFVVDRPRGVSSDELALRDSGHRLSDFE